MRRDMIDIDTRLIPLELQNEPLVQQFVKESFDWFNDPHKFDRKERAGICLHEGTHLHYKRLCGFEPQLFGPGVAYDHRTNSLESYNGGVESLPEDIELAADSVLVAKSFLAPGFAERLLLEHGQSDQEIAKAMRKDTENFLA